MITLFIGAIGAAALLGATSGTGDQVAPVVDPLIGTIPSSEKAPDKMYAQVRSEPRDAAWATKAEAILSARYSKIPHVSTPNAALRVMCSATVCEVAGTIDAPTPPRDEDYDPKHPMSIAMRGLQDASLHNDLKRAGLEGIGSSFGGNAKEQATFVSYYIRSKG